MSIGLGDAESGGGGGGGGKQGLMSDSCRNQNIVSSCILMSAVSRLETGRRFNLFRAILFCFFRSVYLITGRRVH